MGILFIETPDATQGLEFWGAVNGSITYDTTAGVKKSGLASWKADSGAGSNCWVDRTDLTNPRRLSAYFCFSSRPATGDVPFMGYYSAGLIQVRVSTSGVLRLYNGETQLGSDGPTLSTGTPYRIAVTCNGTSARVYVDGALVISSNTSYIMQPAFGWQDVSGSLGANKVLNFQHVYVDDDTSLADPGDIRVTAKVSDSQHVNRGEYTTDGGNGAVFDRPLSEASYKAELGKVTLYQDYTLQTPSVGDVDIGGGAGIDIGGASQLAPIYSGTLEGQTFLATDSCIVSAVHLLLQNSSALNVPLTIGLYATSSGLPTGSALTQATIEGSSLLATIKRYLVTFASPATITAGTYAIVLSNTGGDASNYHGWYAQTSGSYTGGSMVRKDGAGEWTANGMDASLRVYALSLSISLVGRRAWMWWKTSSTKNPLGQCLIDNLVEVAVSEITTPAMASRIVTGGDYPWQMGGIGQRSTGSADDIYLYECGTLIAYKVIPSLLPVISDTAAPADTIPTGGVSVSGSGPAPIERSVSDTQAVADTPTAFLPFYSAAVAEPAQGITETVAGQASTGPVAVSETQAVTEGEHTAQMVADDLNVVATTEGTAVTEAPMGRASLADIAVSETQATSELTEGQGSTGPVAVSETQGASDSAPTAQMVADDLAVTGVSEATSVTENVAALVPTCFASASESVGVADTPAALVPTCFASASEAVGAADSVPAQGVSVSPPPLAVQVSGAALGSIFNDGFESGDASAWDGTGQAGSGSGSYGASYAHDGSYGLRAQGNSPGNNYFPTQSFTAPASRTATVQTWMRWQQQNAGTTVAYVNLGATVGYATLFLGSTNSFGLGGYDRAGVVHEAALSVQPEANVWYLVELVFSWASGTTGDDYARCFINGTEVATLHNTASGTISPPVQAQVGVLPYVGFSQAVADFDTVKVSDAYLGLGGEAVGASDTIPASGVSVVTPSGEDRNVSGVSEATGVTDTPVALVPDCNAGASEAVGVADSAPELLLPSAGELNVTGVSEAVAAADTASGEASGPNAGASEAAAVTEAPSALLANCATAVIDTAGPSDVASAAASDPQAAASSSSALSELALADLALGALVQEEAIVLDDVPRRPPDEWILVDEHLAAEVTTPGLFEVYVDDVADATAVGEEPAVQVGALSASTQEAVDVADAPSVEPLALGAASTETVGIADVIATDPLALVASTQEAVGVADTVATDPLALTAAGLESVGITDTVSASSSAPQAVAQDVSAVTEATEAHLANYATAVTDTAGATEATEALLSDCLASASEATGLTEAVGAHLANYATSVTDTAGATEATEALLANYATAVTEAVGAGELALAEATRTASVSDPADPSDTGSALLPDALAAAVSEAQAVVDQLNVIFEGGAYGQETVSIAELAAGAVSAPEAASSSSIGVGELLALEAPRPASAAEPVTATEAVTGLASDPQASASEATGVTEAAEAHLANYATSVADTAAPGELVAGQATVPAQASDPADPSDAGSALLPDALAAAVSEAAPVAELIASIFEGGAYGVETVGTTELAAGEVSAPSAQAADGAAPADAPLAAPLTMGAAPSEAVGTGEAVQAAGGTTSAAASDTMGVGDAALSSIPTLAVQADEASSVGEGVPLAWIEVAGEIGAATGEALVVSDGPALATGDPQASATEAAIASESPASSLEEALAAGEATEATEAVWASLGITTEAAEAVSAAEAILAEASTLAASAAEFAPVGDDAAGYMAQAGEILAAMAEALLVQDDAYAQTATLAVLVAELVAVGEVRWINRGRKRLRNPIRGMAGSGSLEGEATRTPMRGMAGRTRLGGMAGSRGIRGQVGLTGIDGEVV